METIMHTMVENLLVPAILVIAGSAMIWLQQVANKILKNLEMKSELANLETELSVREKIISTLATHVKAAVAMTMTVADGWKSQGKLNEEQIGILNDLVYSQVKKTVPASLVKEGNILLEKLGGTEALNEIIKTLMEQYVYEYKNENNTIIIENEEEE